MVASTVPSTTRRSASCTVPCTLMPRPTTRVRRSAGSRPGAAPPARAVTRHAAAFRWAPGRAPGSVCGRAGGCGAAETAGGHGGCLLQWSRAEGGHAEAGLSCASGWLACTAAGAGGSWGSASGPTGLVCDLRPTAAPTFDNLRVLAQAGRSTHEVPRPVDRVMTAPAGGYPNHGDPNHRSSSRRRMHRSTCTIAAVPSTGIEQLEHRHLARQRHDPALRQHRRAARDSG